MNKRKNSRRASRSRTLMWASAFKKGFRQRSMMLPIDDSYSDNPRNRWLYEVGRLWHASQTSEKWRDAFLSCRAIRDITFGMENDFYRAFTIGDIPK